MCGCLARCHPIRRSPQPGRRAAVTQLQARVFSEVLRAEIADLEQRIATAEGRGAGRGVTPDGETPAHPNRVGAAPPEDVGSAAIARRIAESVRDRMSAFDC